MRVLGLIVGGMFALAASIAGHAAPSGSSMKQLVPASGIVHVLGRLRLGLAPGAWPLEPVERRMGSPALRP